MSNVVKLKKQAAEYELKKQFDKALAIYVKLLASFDENADELDVALFNRVGDLMLRQGNVAEAVDYYESAVDRYADTGFFNNAIALCNKILRHSPGRAIVYYKLGRISALKGFKNDAKVNFLEYADRMQKGGKVDEAFRALKEFADLCPEQDEIRLMLADQLTKADRKDEAIEQLQVLYERYETEGRGREASATAERIRAIDSTVELRSASGVWRKSSAVDLVFLDLDEPSPRNGAGTPTPVVPPTVDKARWAKPPEPEREREPTPERPTPAVAATRETPPSDDTTLSGITRIGDNMPRVDETPTESLPGLESTRLDDDVDDGDVPSISQPAPDLLDDLESTSLDIPDADEVQRSNTPTHSSAAQGYVERVSGELELILPDVELKPPREQPSTQFDVSSLTTPPLTAPAARPTPNTTRVALEGLPLMDLEVPQIKARPPRLSTPLGRSAVAGDLELIEDPDALDSQGANRALNVPPDVESVADVPDSSDSLDGLVYLEDPREPDPVEHRDDSAFGGILLSELETELVPIDEVENELVPVDKVESELVPVEEVDEVEEIKAEEVEVEEVDVADKIGEVDEFHDINEVDGTDDINEVDEGDDIDHAESESPTPPVSRPSTVVAVHALEALKASVEGDPENWGLHREMAEAMLEAGDRAGGIRELEGAMTGADRAGDLDFASSLAEEIARIEPEVVRHHQKRVEYAFRTNDRSRLIEAYLSLADALLRSDQADKSRTVYQRVLDLAPDEARARAALEAVPVPEPEPPPAPPRQTTRRGASAPPVADAPAARTSESFVNLGDWLRDDQGPKDTRMVVAEQEPSGDEDADFADMLRKFKQGVAENVDAEDYQSHYDLAIAYKEMGLLDEAISEFQKSLGGVRKVPTYEALGQCFMEKGQYKLASSILVRALNEKASEDQLVGVLYLLGRSAEEQGLADDALAYYQRVFVLDIQFRDVADRISEVERAAR